MRVGRVPWRGDVRPHRAQAARWRHWLTEALGDGGIPPNAALELQVRPCGGAAITRLQLDLRWAEPDAEPRAHVEVLVPIRRAIGTGWSGWPAYAAGLKLLRALG